MADEVLQDSAIVRHCENCIQFRKWKLMDEEKRNKKADAARRLVPAMCIILAALADDRVVIDATTFNYRTNGEEVASERIPAFYHSLQPASRREWLSLKFGKGCKPFIIP